ncbi:hypothetical protein HPB52_009080 [Rhipicephalus sanguineus]|uniref:Uncharacterized protein n=1 Tax=Rhipicephalus sanguineus TaxID=34632 RepID=A0A9D4PR25_RHISA|nr:hypothetical protein HPB52_009080 [Rhipicephalus sanguineus]
MGMKGREKRRKLIRRSKSAQDTRNSSSALWARLRIVPCAFGNRNDRRRVATRSYIVTDWTRFRELSAASPPSGAAFFTHVSRCVGAASRKCVVPVGTPVPDIKLLNLRAVRQRHQRRATKSERPELWTLYNHLDAKCRRHAKRRRDQSWDSLCGTLEDPRRSAKAWRIFGAILRPVGTRFPALAIAVARGLSYQQLAELLADTLCTVVAGDATGIPELPQHHRRELMTPHRFLITEGIQREVSSLCNAYFTLGELRLALASRKRRSAPRPDENLNH